MQKLKRAMPFIITGIMVAAAFIIRFMVIRPSDMEDVKSFWLTLGVNAAIIVAMALTWMASGTDRAKTEADSAFQRNSAEYSRRIAALEKESKLTQLTEFCRQKTRELLDEKINARLAAVCIDRNRYDSELKDKTAEQLASEGLNKKQIQAVERVRDGRVKVRPLNAMELMTNNKARAGYDVHYDENAEKAVSIAVRVAKSIVTGAALALISVQLASNITDLSVWAMFLMQLFTIAFTSWSSEREGYEQIAVTKNAVILRRIMFLNMFSEWAEVPRLEEGKGDNSLDKKPISLYNKDNLG